MVPLLLMSASIGYLAPHVLQKPLEAGIIVVLLVLVLTTSGMVYWFTFVVLATGCGLVLYIAGAPQQQQYDPTPEPELPKQLQSSRQSRLERIYQANAKAYKGTIAREDISSNLTIRLLLLHAGPFESPISGNLVEAELVKLKSSIAYTTLSWAWGGIQETNGIILNGEAFMVASNAHERLRRVRTAFSPCYVWLHAICINHADKREEAQQIEQMSRIYRTAARVALWWGPYGYNTKDTAQNCRGHEEIGLKDAQQAQEKTRGKISKASVPLVVEHSRDYLQWWWRAWTVCTSPFSIAIYRTYVQCRCQKRYWQPTCRFSWVDILSFGRIS
jgi:hypothetical protein